MTDIPEPPDPYRELKELLEQIREQVEAGLRLLDQADRGEP